VAACNPALRDVIRRQGEILAAAGARPGSLGLPSEADRGAGLVEGRHVYLDLVPRD